eukprot:CAMPEP_0119095530 /NCGR_PEP_ID=MMETSP1178-20130426/169876_1 /TAXON_ID=33656 /ORGANISM="unid sp, Strain CCMP2000" /LENGTH=35 /DNA_ID= /DNA_START= /DNA_END= /DNA_ORIENTATION=
MVLWQRQNSFRIILMPQESRHHALMAQCQSNAQSY